MSTSAASVSEQEYAQIRQELVRAVRRICPRWLVADSEDLVQNALIRVMRIRRRDETRTDLSASYLWRAAHSAVIDEIRRRQRRQEVALDAPHEQRPDPRPEPDDWLEAGRLGQAVRHCLEGLISPRRSAVTLRIQGHTVSEVAELAGWNIKRAKNLTYRGLADLRECLEAKGHHLELD